MSSTLNNNWDFILFRVKKLELNEKHLKQLTISVDADSELTIQDSKYYFLQEEKEGVLIESFIGDYSNDSELVQNNVYEFEGRITIKNLTSEKIRINFLTVNR